MQLKASGYIGEECRDSALPQEPAEEFNQWELPGCMRTLELCTVWIIFPHATEYIPAGREIELEEPFTLESNNLVAAVFAQKAEVLGSESRIT